MSHKTRERLKAILALVIMFLAYGIAGHFDYEYEQQRLRARGVHVELIR